MIRGMLFGVFLGFLLLSNQGCATVFDGVLRSYSADTIEGRVVDKETGNPVEGAVVVAQWILQKPLGGVPRTMWVVRETITDVDGRYKLQGWKSRRRPFFKLFLDPTDPEILVFKSGYWMKVLTNEHPNNMGSTRGFNENNAQKRRAYWNGKDIHLWPFRLGEKILRSKLFTIHSDSTWVKPDPKDFFIVTEETLIRELSHLQGGVAWGQFDLEEEPWEEEDWVRIKHLARAINRECKKLDSRKRFQVDQVPEEHQKLILGNESPCY